MMADTMNARVVLFGLVAVATVITAIAVDRVELYVAVIVPASYAMSKGVGAPYAKNENAACAGIVSTLSFIFLLIAAALTAPASTAFDVAWYGYTATSSLYALEMWSAESKLSTREFVIAYAVLMLAIAFSVAVSVRVVIECDSTAGKIFGVAGGLFSAALDGTVTAFWFMPDNASRFRLFIGFFFVVVFGLAFVDDTVMRVAFSITAAFAFVAALCTIERNQSRSTNINIGRSLLNNES